MVQRRAGSDQLAHDAVVAQVRRGDQRRAVVAAGGQPGAGAQLQQHAQRLFVVGHGGDGDGVVAVVLQQAEIGTGRGQRADRLALAREGGHVQRRAAMAVARVDCGACGQQRAQRGQVAAVRGGVQAGVARRFLRRRRHLGQHRQRRRPRRPAAATARRGASLAAASLSASSAAIAHCSSRWPPGAPPTPTAPMTSLPTFTGTPPPSSRKPGMCTRLAAAGFFCARFHHRQRGVLRRGRGVGLQPAGFQRVRAGVVGALHGAHATGAVDHGGGDVVAAGAAGGHGARGDLVGQLERHVAFGAHGLRLGGGDGRGGGNGQQGGNEGAGGGHRCLLQGLAVRVQTVSPL